MARTSRKNTQSPSWLLSLGAVVLILLGVYLLWQYKTQQKPTPAKGIAIDGLVSDYKAVLPAAEHDWQVLEYTGFTLAYNELIEQPAWVAYVLTDSMVLFGDASRKDHFYPDPNITTGSAGLEDYRRSGYSRGHLAPAADMKWSTQAMEESFYLSNMSPQLQNFNGGIWKTLEEKVRDWAVSEKVIMVVTGPVFKKSTKTIGENKVGVPDYFYKVILDVSAPEYKAIGFIMPHVKGKKELYEYAVSVDSVEVFTGLDFFPALADSTEGELERSLELSWWPF